MYSPSEANTICALATAPGSGAIATIRISGPRTYDVLKSIFKSAKARFDWSAIQAYSVHFGEIMAGQQALDQVLMTCFKRPQSYTGEDSIEISCHGSTYIQQRIIELLLEQGVHLAEPGEFTQRAFFNGKLDLAQAEGVADVIASETKAMHNVALNQLKGGFSSDLEQLRHRMLHFIAMLELELDFSEEDVEFANRKELEQFTQDILTQIARLIDSFRYGNALKNGVPVAIVGKPNAGKSTLLNTLLNENRAIVSAQAGTTRDTIEAHAQIEGIQFRFIDTAGLRQSNDEIEQQGVERTHEQLKRAAVYLYLFDATQMNISQVFDAVAQLETTANRIIVANKTDLLDSSAIEQLQQASIDVLISAKSKLGIEQLKHKLMAELNFGAKAEQVVVTNLRHVEALKMSQESLLRAQQGIRKALTGDLIALDMRQAAHFLGSITSPISHDEVLGHIFKNFCIGK